MTTQRSGRQRRRRARIVSVCVRGTPLVQDRHNPARLELLRLVLRAVAGRPGWTDLDAVLFPAGFFRGPGSLGPLPARDWADCLASSPILRESARGASRLNDQSPGCIVSTGFDMPMASKGWRGDHLMVAANAAGLVGCARKFFPVDDATAASAYGIFPDDVDDLLRLVSLPCGQTALLSVCYDAFAIMDSCVGPTAKRRGLRYAFQPDGDWHELKPYERDALVERYHLLLERAKPTVHLIGIHKFALPGRDGYWQRHGVATASAGLRGAFCVGAAHFTRKLPVSPEQSCLTAAGVSHHHLSEGSARKAWGCAPVDSFTVNVPDKATAALVRLFEA